jgi:hypothetical protein
VAKDNAQKKRDYHYRLGNIAPIPKVKNRRRRNKCKNNLEVFLKTYLPHLFYRSFSPDHKKTIKRLQQVIKTGGKSSRALPRGFGKTTIGIGAVLWATLYGHREFLVFIGPSEEHAKEIVSDYKAELETNDLLLEDFPEVCFPIQQLEGRHARARTQHVDGVLTNIKWTGSQVTFPTIKDSALSGITMRAAGITSSIRGMKKGKKRPDFVLLDDPQTRETAASAAQTKKLEQIILGDILGLAGHDKTIAVYMPCTVIYKGDLADIFLDPELHPEWGGQRGKLVYAWPENDLWDDYDELWRTDQLNGDPACTNATAFYKKNQKAMDKGVKIADPELFDSDIEISAIQHAQNLKLQSPEAFEAEYQNDPMAREFTLYEITPKLVMQRVNNLPRLKLDGSVKLVVAFCDINFSALHWSLMGFRNDWTGFVLDYGKIPERGVLVQPNANKKEIRDKVYNGLTHYISKLESLDLRIPIRAAAIDRGFEPETVHNFCNYNKASFALIPAKGYAGTQ